MGKDSLCKLSSSGASPRDFRHAVKKTDSPPQKPLISQKNIFQVSFRFHLVYLTLLPLLNEQTDENTGMRYYHVGLKKRISGSEHWTLKEKDDLSSDSINCLEVCFSLTSKKNRWKKAIKTLESDTNFSDMNLCQLIDLHKVDLARFASKHDIRTAFSRPSTN